MPKTETPDVAVFATVKEVADHYGLSKTTVARYLKRVRAELGVEAVRSETDGRGTEVLTPEVASALAAEIEKKRPRRAEDEDGRADEGMWRVKAQALQARVTELERENGRLIDQLDKKDAAALEVGEQAQARIDELKAENERLRADLALSRRLEGFHWPWTRDRIKAQHLLPSATEK